MAAVDVSLAPPGPEPLLPRHLRDLLARAGVDPDLRAGLRAASRGLGFVGFSYFAAFDAASGKPQLVWSTHGAAWDERYAVSGLVTADPRLVTPSTVTPTLWDCGRCAVASSALPFLEAARQQGFGSGVVVRIVDATQRLAIVALDRKGDALAAATIEALVDRVAELMLFALVLHATLLAPRLAPRDRGRPREILSPREHSCLDLVARGLTSKDIGHKLGITPRTADFHVGNALRKLGALNRSEAIAMGLRTGLIDRPHG